MPSAAPVCLRPPSRTDRGLYAYELGECDVEGVGDPDEGVNPWCGVPCSMRLIVCLSMADRLDDVLHVVDENHAMPSRPENGDRAATPDGDLPS